MTMLSLPVTSLYPAVTASTARIISPIFKAEPKLHVHTLVDFPWRGWLSAYRAPAQPLQLNFWLPHPQAWNYSGICLGTMIQ